MEEINSVLKNNWQNLEQYCVAIYKGGSRLDPVIDQPHDYDYICFAKPLMKTFLLSRLSSLGLRTTLSKKNKPTTQDNISDFDFSQIRVYPYTQITWFSYLDVLMEKAIGEDVCPKTDVINTHREEFIEELKKKMNLLLAGKITNQKRWYHILRGVYIVMNSSYEVTAKQKQEINILHDLSEGWETIRDKTINLLKNL